MRAVTKALYLVRPGDTPWSVAVEMYGDGERYPKLVELNPGEWEPGSHIYLPDIAGHIYTLQEDATSAAALTQIGKPVNVASLSKFYKFNGGDFRHFKAREEVFYPSS